MVRSRFDTIPKRESTSRSVNIFRDLFQVVNSVVHKYFRVVSAMLRVRILVLIHAPRFVRRHEHAVMKCLCIDSGLWWGYKSGSLRSAHSDSILHAKA